MYSHKIGIGYMVLIDALKERTTLTSHKFLNYSKTHSNRLLTVYK